MFRLGEKITRKDPENKVVFSITRQVSVDDETFYHIETADGALSGHVSADKINSSYKKVQ